MVNLYEITHNQDTLNEIFKKLNISEEQLGIIPWSIGEAVINQQGSIIAYLTNSASGTPEILDVSTNILGKITSNNHENYQLWGQFMEYISDISSSMNGNIEFTSVFGDATDSSISSLLEKTNDLPELESIETITSILDFI